MAQGKFIHFKRKFILILAVVTGCCYGQSSMKGNEYILTGEIIHNFALPAHCGVIAWGTVIEFKITSFTDTKYTAKEIGIVFTCPEFYGPDFFRTGGKYEVQLSDENQASFGWVIINEDKLNQYSPGYIPYAISAKRLDITSK